MTVEQKLDRLTGIVEALAGTVVAHDNQIEGLIQVAEKQHQEITKVTEGLFSLERQLEAYLKRLPPQ